MDLEELIRKVSTLSMEQGGYDELISFVSDLSALTEINLSEIMDKLDEIFNGGY